MISFFHFIIIIYLSFCFFPVISWAVLLLIVSVGAAHFPVMAIHRRRIYLLSNRRMEMQVMAGNYNIITWWNAREVHK